MNRTHPAIERVMEGLRSPQHRKPSLLLASAHQIGAALFELDRDAALAFSIPIRGGRVLVTVGDAIDFVTRLSQERLDRHYWYRAVVMLNTAVKRPQFLATATINLHTAVAMDRLLSEA